MTFETWLAFAVASFVIVTIPGPTVLMIVSYALGHGKRAAYAIVAGVALGDFTAMTASMLGLGALLATSAEIFSLTSLGMRAGPSRPVHKLKSKPAIPTSPAPGRSGSTGERRVDATPMPRSFPVRTCGRAEGMLSKKRAVFPASRSTSAGALPL